MKVKELMTAGVRACRRQDRLNDAAQVMWEADCGCVPVVDEQACVVGMLTDRDICMAAYTQGKPLAAIAVESAMARPVVSCMTDDDIAMAERSMRQARVRRLPVIDREGQLAGILSLNDIARRAAAERTQKVRAVTADDVAATLAAIGEPRSLPASPPPAVQKASLRAASAALT